MFSMVTDRLTDKVKQESPWMIMFVDDIVIYSESRKQGKVYTGKQRNKIQT